MFQGLKYIILLFVQSAFYPSLLPFISVNIFSDYPIFILYNSLISIIVLKAL
jgi:hypothetical protein